MLSPKDNIHSTSSSWILLLALLTAIAPLSTDMYLPALPVMAQHYDVSTLVVANSLPAYFLGLALGQLIYGPLSDRIGRKKPLLFGLSLHIIASILCVYVEDIQSLLWLRILQALGSCVGLVLARAAIRDILSTDQAAKAFASMMIVMGIAPVIAPTLGAWLLLILPWQAIFWALACLGLVALLWVIFKFEETLPIDRRLKLSFLQVGQLYLNIFKDRSFVSPMLAGCFSFGVLFCYINVAAAVLMDIFHLNQQQFAYVFGTNAIGTIILSAMNHRLEGKFNVVQRLHLGGYVQLMGIFLMAVANLWQEMRFVGTVLGLFLAVAGIGLTAPNSMALAMSKQGRQAGSASALMGSIQFGFGLLSGILLNILLFDMVWNLIIAMFIFVFCSNLFIYYTKKSISVSVLSN